MHRRGLLTSLLAAAVLLLPPQILPWFTDCSYYFYLIDLMGIFAIGTLELGLLVGFAGQISIGHAAFMAIGAFFSGFTTLQLGWPFWLALPAAGLAAL